MIMVWGLGVLLFFFMVWGFFFFRVVQGFGF